MASLVADYGDSSPEGTASDNDMEENDTEDIVSESKETKLPPPTFSEVKNSVFVNPYLEAENAQIAVLEKHMKMVPQTKSKMKKICWMFKRGKCRYGGKCRFMHSEQISAHNKTPTEEMSPDEMEEVNGQPQQIVPDIREDESKKRKWKSGLPRGLIPSKKVLKLYKKIKKDEES